jgi:hypothetical protein
MLHERQYGTVSFEHPLYVRILFRHGNIHYKHHNIIYQLRLLNTANTNSLFWRKPSPKLHNYLSYIMFNIIEVWTIPYIMKT